MADSSLLFTPQFREYCDRYYEKLKPFTASGVMRPFSQKNAKEMLADINQCTEHQLAYIQDFLNRAKADFELHVAKMSHISAKQQKDIDDYRQFFADLEKKAVHASKEKEGKPSQQNSAPSSYKPSPATGQSFYESIMHILGYDATTVGASAMFYLAFAALRFMLMTPYIEQLAEYNAADPSKRFDPNNLTDQQILANLDKDSTRQQIIQAGFLPPPNLAHAFDVEFNNFMQKIGALSKQQMEDRPNQLGRRLTHPVPAA